MSGPILYVSSGLLIVPGTWSVRENLNAGEVPNQKYIYENFIFNLTLKMLPSMLTSHPNENGMSYIEHLKRSWSFSVRFGVASVKAFVHGMFPPLFQSSSTELVKELYDEVSEFERSMDNNKFTSEQPVEEVNREAPGESREVPEEEKKIYEDTNETQEEEL